MLDTNTLDHKWANAKSLAAGFTDFHKISPITYVSTQDMDATTGLFMLAIRVGLNDQCYPELVKLITLPKVINSSGFRIIQLLRDTVTIREGDEAKWSDFFRYIYEAHVNSTEVKSLWRYTHGIVESAKTNEGVYAELYKSFTLEKIFQYAKSFDHAMFIVLNARYELGEIDAATYRSLLEVNENLSDKGFKHIEAILNHYFEDSEFVEVVSKAYVSSVCRRAGMRSFNKILNENAVDQWPYPNSQQNAYPYDSTVPNVQNMPYMQPVQPVAQDEYQRQLMAQQRNLLQYQQQQQMLQQQMLQQQQWQQMCRNRYVNNGHPNNDPTATSTPSEQSLGNSDSGKTANE